jgi:hypothetical protein
MSGYIYFICYPRGDKSKITVAYESIACDYEIRDYALASRQRWYESKPAIEYCKQLAKEFNLTYVPFDDEDGNSYLD